MDVVQGVAESSTKNNWSKLRIGMAGKSAVQDILRSVTPRKKTHQSDQVAETEPLSPEMLEAKLAREERQQLVEAYHAVGFFLEADFRSGFSFSKHTSSCSYTHFSAVHVAHLCVVPFFRLKMCLVRPP